MGSALPSVFSLDLPGGSRFSHVLKRHHVLRLEDSQGGANVSALFYNADLLLERYNMPDTLKAQYTSYLTRGRVLLSDMGRVLCSIVEDTAGYHDTLCGHSDAAGVLARYGKKNYQEARNAFHRNARDNLLIELSQWGLGKQDLVANVNFFSKVVADDDGKLTFVPRASGGARVAHVALRAEMNVLVVLAVNPHPLDPRPDYDPRPVALSVGPADAPGPDDECRRSRPEAARAFENTERFFQ
jgi:urea carboxylase-associated protein 2